MSSPLICVEGLLESGRGELDRLVASAAVDRSGRVLVPMLDLLALARLDRSAEILVVEFVDGSSHALTIRDLVLAEDVLVHLDVPCDSPSVVARLVSVNAHRCVPGTAIIAIRAITFASFVGGP